MIKEQLFCTPWRKSSHSSGGEGQCVEVATLAAQCARRMIGMRDSKNPDGPVLSFTLVEWSAFLGHVKQDAFNPTL